MAAWRRLAWLLVAGCALAWAAPARAQSFDCKKAGTETEKRICGDPALALADVALAKAFQAALKKAPAEAKQLRAEQRRWLEKRRDACNQAGHLLAVMQERAGALQRFAEGLGGVTGSYQGGEASLELLDLGDGQVRFSIAATWHGANPGQIHTGELCGRVTWEDGQARFEDKAIDCLLRFRFRDGEITIEQDGLCDFGMNVTAAWTYARKDSRPPVFALCGLP